MDGTRESLLNRIVAWATDRSAGKNGSNTYWIYGLPGIGKTSLAHSICARLHDKELLAATFFCRRDNSELNNPRNILPTLIHQLAIVFPPFRSIVAKEFRRDPHKTPASMKETFLPDRIRALRRHPKHTLVFVIDALDETVNTESQLRILRALTIAAAQVTWLRIIITSRREIHIQSFFDAPSHPSHIQYDLAADQEASGDLKTFAQKQFNLVAAGYPVPWPPTRLFDKALSRAKGLFIFIKTIVLTLEAYDECDAATQFLEAALQHSEVTGFKSLYKLYSNILELRIARGPDKIQEMIRVLVASAPYRSLRKETIAELTGVQPYLIEKWVKVLSSLLYEDEGANRGVRVRHTSISDFFISNECPSEYRVNRRDANIQLGIACLATMIGKLRFNICSLKDSRLANAEIENLQSRIGENISDSLQYSCLYWSDHLSSSHKNLDQRGQEQLKIFFEGWYPLFWIEVLSLMGMVSACVPSLRRVILTCLKVSMTGPQLEVVSISRLY